MKLQSDWDKFYIGVADLISKQSYAKDRKVGAIVVNDNNIISFSYNGTPRGWSNETEDIHGKTLPTVLHAEAQAICKVARSAYSTVGSTLYSTLSPCLDCSKLISEVGIKRLVYKDKYKEESGILFLKRKGVYVNEIPSNTKLIPPEILANTGL